ncbi:MAG: hypothetical protein KAG61_04785 [Bacteriovoracaceae bacterium]|nr:hypothetical protein [Bacteriovoracaceae bacterium]
MKIVVLLLLAMLSHTALSATAMVIAHRAPMFKYQKMDSVVYQYISRGEKIFINNKHIDRTFLTNYRADNSIGKELVIESKYYTTSDRIGRTAYILKRHVKIIYNDTRELDSPVSLGDKDDTDYRIKSKLPKDYPFIHKKNRYSTLMLATETTSKNSYPYPNQINKDSIGDRYKLAAIAAWKADFDKLDRFYFGTKGHISFSQNKYFFINGTMANEANLILGIGPYASYDFYKSENIILRLGGGITLNFHRAKISQDSDDGFRDRQYYDSLFFAPEVTLDFVKREIFEKIDLLVGSSIRVNQPYTLKTKMKKYEKEIWSSNQDQIEHPLGINIDFGIGLSYKF